MTKNEIFNFLVETKNNYNKTENGFKKIFPIEYNELNSYKFPNNFYFLQKLWHYLHDDFELKLGLCEYCGNRTDFYRFNQGYKKFCSRKCANSSETHHVQYKETCLKKYGVDNASKAESIKHKKSKTCISHFGVDNPSKCKEIQETKKETNRKRYGYDYHSQSKHHKDSVHKTWKNKSKEEIDRIVKQRNENFISIIDEWHKRGITKCGVSKVELNFYDYLIQHFDKTDIIYNYRSEKYPFYCDFYIKSLDLYIELNVFWTHGSHPFNELNQNDLNKINYWKSKNSSYFDNAIIIWTKKDVKKRNVAKENNLKYIEIFECNIEHIINDFKSKLSQIICV